MPKAFLSPREMAQAIGLSESSLKRWIDDGELAVSRTAGGHRRIPLQEAVRFARSGKVAVRNAACLGLDVAVGAAAACHQPDDRLYRALFDGDAGQARALLQAAFVDGQSIAALCDGALRCAMGRFCALLKEGEEGVAAHHVAVAICKQAIEALRILLPEPGPQAPAAIGATWSDDPCALPSLMAAATLGECGWRTINLGPLTTCSVLRAAMVRHRPKLIWRTVTVIKDPAATAKHIRRFAAELEGVPLVVAGPALAHLGQAGLCSGGNLHLAGSMGELAAFARGFLGLKATRRRA